MSDTTNEQLPAEPATEQKATPPSGWKAWMKEWIIVLSVALICSFVIKTFIFNIFFVPSGSMENTLQVGDRIVANVASSNFTSLQRGDIVIFEDTQGWLPADPNQKEPTKVQNALAATGIISDPSSRHMVKRVIGLPGDTIECCDDDGRIKINGQSIDETYLKRSSSSPITPGASTEFKVTVPEGGIWVMGDNRDQSSDSRFHMDLESNGVVRQEDVVGTVTILAWPLDRVGLIKSGAEVFKALG